MSRKVAEIRIKQFFQDKKLLHYYNDVDIATKMKIDKSSYSSYINFRNTITNGFLNKFYTAFGEEINEIQEKRKQTDKGKGIDYTKSNNLIDELLKRVEELEIKYDRLVQSDDLIIIRLEQKLDHILDGRLEKLEQLINRMIAGENPAVAEGGEGESPK
jgi:hypothetical protein